MIYGLYDTQDNLWMGDCAAPLLFHSEVDDDGNPGMAKARAAMCDKQLGQVPGRTQPREWVPGELRIRDERPVVKDPMTSLIELEEGK